MLYLKKVRFLLFTLLVFVMLSYPSSAATYKVIQNDSIYKVANLFRTSVATIMRENKLSSSTIYPGQVLYVPSDTYSVKGGDTLYLISNRYSISLYSIRRANNEWDNYIYTGQKLALPGIVGGINKTLAGTSSKAVIPYTSEDLDLLARLITAEAESQPYSAKVGVGAVVVNRVKSSDFANSIKSVIYEKLNGYYQFTPVKNGWIYKPASQEAKNAAYQALHGSDPTNGAIFYFDDSATSSWIWSRPIAIRIGRMVYTY
ncbi:MAG TPA: peptidoglycan-binding protein [Clostridiales bacterium]|nr:peptidoglycan-binding protein [Clostridiales bacterium]